MDYARLGFVGERDPTRAGLSRTKQTKILEEMLAACVAYIRAEFVPALEARFREILGEGDWSVAITGTEPHVVHFRYPKAIATGVSYVVPQVILELGTHAEFVPRESFRIRPFAAEEFPKVFEEPDLRVTALLAKRTFWEKATILHAEYHRAPLKALPLRYSRHYYDVAILAQGKTKREALADVSLLAQVVRHKQVFYPSAWARYDLAVPGSLRLVPSDLRLPELKQDYREMAVMIFGEAPQFDALMKQLADLESEINGELH